MFPILFHFVCVAVDVHFAENVGVAEDKFVVEGVGNVGNVEIAFLFADFGVEEDVEQQVAQFFADVHGIVVKEGVAEFVGFFDSVGTKRFVGLFTVPRTFHAEDVEGVDNAAEGFNFFLTRMHGYCV